MESTGSPKKRTAVFAFYEDPACGSGDQQTHTRSPNRKYMPLMTSQKENLLPEGKSAPKKIKEEDPAVEEMMSRLQVRERWRENGDGQVSSDKSNADIKPCIRADTTSSMHAQASHSTEEPKVKSEPDTSAEMTSTTHAEAAHAEVLELKRELEAVHQQIAAMDQELAQSRITQHTVEQAIGSPWPDAQHLALFAPDTTAPSTLSTSGNTLRGRNRTSPVHSVSRVSRAPAGGLRINTLLSADNDIFAPQSTIPSPQYPHPPPTNCHFGYTPPMTPLGVHNSYAIPNVAMRQPQPPIGTRASPAAMMFPHAQATGWHGEPTPSGMTYVNATEPLNYGLLLERNVTCNWKLVVERIVYNNDQQASLSLQTKLKTGTADQKFEIVNAIIDQAYPLMVNRFGNFVVQRGIDHGTTEQVIAIAQAIRGHTVNLSMNAFGCHVVQHAFDHVPEEYKAIMVHELLSRIPETVIHRYACHVWQKLFELRWSGSPPQIMKHVNEALRGMWHEVALGETGSLVVQNIFENCLEDDKRPCINEVIASIDVIAHGQFGNWCIQHICEHGSVPDRTRATDHVLRFATEYSMDQFASKVVEKCLKIGGTNFLDRYLDRVCKAHPERPRMPLIDIAGDQFGNYLIQYILTNADHQRREIVAGQVRRHMVSLRGSKYGSRVAMLCSNPAVATRPGVPVGMSLARNNSNYSDRVATDTTHLYPTPRQSSSDRRTGHESLYH